MYIVGTALELYPNPNRFFFSVNVLGGGKKTGLFNVPELDSSHGFAHIKEKCFDTSESLVAEACNPDRDSSN